MSDFRTFSQSLAVDLVETKTAIGQIVLALKVIMIDFSSELFITIVCWKVSKLIFQADYLPQLSAAQNTSKYWQTLYWKVAARNVRFFYLSLSFAVDVVETKKDIN